MSTDKVTSTSTDAGIDSTIDADADTDHDTMHQAVDESTREKIEHLLTIYPFLSPSMLQIGIGTSLPPALWRPILDGMIREGKVVKHSVSVNTPAGRSNSYTLLAIAGVKHPKYHLEHNDLIAS